MEANRKIAIKDFSGPGEHAYEDELGFRDFNYEEAQSLIDREVFHYNICEVRLQMVFYHIDTDAYYTISTLSVGSIKCKKLKKNTERSPYIYWQCEHDADEDGEILAEFQDPEEIWDNLRIDGKPISEILKRSFITALN